MNNKKPQGYGSMASTSEVEFAGTSTSDYNGLCDNIVTNIYTINQSRKTLESCHKLLGTNKDNQGLRDKIHVTQLSTNQIISITSRNIHKLTMTVRRGEKAEKLRVEMLTNNFKEAIAMYSSLQQEVANKMKANMLVVASIEASTEEQEEELQQQAQMTRDVAFEQDQLLEREQNIKKIESNIIDVNQIMRELSAMVNEQGEALDTIENSIDYAVGNVEEGTAELTKASGYQNKYRRRLCYLAIIAFIIAAILIAILVIQLKKN